MRSYVSPAFPAAIVSPDLLNTKVYNLAGQKVNASYKGVVIKDGKKYIQK